jgi:hypothetical protein
MQPRRSMCAVFDDRNRLLMFREVEDGWRWLAGRLESDRCRERRLGGARGKRIYGAAASWRPYVTGPVTVKGAAARRRAGKARRRPRRRDRERPGAALTGISPLTRWPAFTRFLADDRICLTNNVAERALLGLALGRKSWLFADRSAGRGGPPSCTRSSRSQKSTTSIRRLGSPTSSPASPVCHRRNSPSPCLGIGPANASSQGA